MGYTEYPTGINLLSPWCGDLTSGFTDWDSDDWLDISPPTRSYDPAGIARIVNNCIPLHR